MNKRRHIVCVVGTRPEAIKLMPVIRVLRASAWARCTVVTTAQHRGLLDQALEQFGIAPDVDLDMMTENQTLPSLTARVLPELTNALSAQDADAVLAQGDTATVFLTALAAFYLRIPFGHVEAGLRTYNLDQPYPEEGFRQIVARIARWHFAPTAAAASNLRSERILPQHVHVTGNTGIDALLSVAARLPPPVTRSERMILLTAHRRESFGAPLREIFAAVRTLVDEYPDVRVVYPVHPNPNVHETAHALLGGHERIELCEPVGYVRFVELMRDAHFILTDSGGIQEEAPALAKPVLVLREQTERPEAIAAGVARLVGTRRAEVLAGARKLLDDPREYRAMAVGASPYGDGHAAERIAAIIRDTPQT